MHIWLAPSAFHPARGGVEELTLQLAREYLRRGHEVAVLVHRHPDDLPSVETVEGVPVRRLDFSLPGRRLEPLVGYPVHLARQARHLASLDGQPDVIHVQCPANQVPALAVYSRRHGIPLVITTQGEVKMDADAVYEHSLQMRLSLRLGSRWAALLTACSRRAASDAASVAPLFARSVVIPNGVDVSQWDVTALPPERAYAAWGRHVPQKGFDLLIRAFALLREQQPDAILRIGGDGPETPRLRALAGDGVHFVGPLDRAGVQRLLTQSRVAVVPSRLEPFGIVAVEAMATGRGVVWSTNGGLDEATGGLGRGVDPADPESLAAAMLAASDDPLDPGVARAHAESLAWSNIAERYLSDYRRLADGR